MGKVKAILIDSGKVLNGPVTGEWFVTPNFFEYVDKKKVEKLNIELINKAFQLAGDYISKQDFIVTEEEEYKHFLKYYNIFFDTIKELNVSKENIENVTKDLVYNYDKYRFYDDVIEVIPTLHKNYKLAVVSDAWPSLLNVFKKADMTKYFSAIVISSFQGVTKPNDLMYTTALKELSVEPNEAIFIDDSLKNCKGAEKLGIRSILICRDKEDYLDNKNKLKDIDVINNFKELLEII